MNKIFQRRIKTILALILCSAIILSGSIYWWGFAGYSAIAAIGGGAYTSMYDSNLLVEQELSKIAASYEQEEAGLERSIAELDELGALETDRTWDSSRAANGDDANLASDTLDTHSLTGSVARTQIEEELRLLRQDKQQELQESREHFQQNLQVDRFIIKYKKENHKSIADKIAALETEALQLNPLSPENGKYELLQLSEKVNPQELAQQLKGQTAEREIEYIQPDFSLGLEDLAEYSNRIVTEANGDKGGSLAAGKADEERQNDTDEPGETTLTGEIPSKEDQDITAEKSAQISAIKQAQTLIGVLDTGVDLNHPDLQNYLTEGWNFIDDSAQVYDPENPSDCNHGTHVAGIIAETIKNQESNAKILPLKIFSGGSAYTSDVLRAIQYAEEQGVTIINCSFGSNVDNQALKEAVEESKMLFICAAGNSRNNLAEKPVYPAAYRFKNVISVGSVNRDGGFSYFSNYSPDYVDITALGREVMSTLPENAFGNMTGTSMATAQVTGAAAVIQEDPAVTNREVRQRLFDSADRLDNLTNKANSGRRLNLENAIVGAPGEYLSLNPEEDFDVFGYDPSDSELLKLYSSAGGVTKIAAGYYFTLALKEDGTVWAWGANDYGQCGNGQISFNEKLTQVIGLSGITEIAAGRYHALAVKSDGTVWSWGENIYGQLGNGNTTNRSIPVQVQNLTGAKTVSAGMYFSLAAKQDGNVAAWGYNAYGQLGDGTTTTRHVPVNTSILNVKNVAAGGSHSTALKADGTIWTWGNNSYGQLGDGTTTKKTTPSQVIGLSNITGIAARNLVSAALKQDGTLWAWGRNSNGQLGDGTTTDRFTPVMVSNLTGVKNVGLGVFHSLAIKQDGTVWSWGYNAYGQLGDDSTTQSATPVQAQSLTGVVVVSGGYYHSVALKSDGSVWAWGSNHEDQLGTGGTANSRNPRQMNNLSGTVIAAGSYHNLVVKPDGAVWAWGNNTYGQLGDGTTVDKYIPAKVNNLNNVVKLSGRYLFSLALKSDGTVWGWGSNLYGQLGDGTVDNNRSTPVQVSNLTNVIAISTGYFHSLALKSDGTVWAWGRNANYQLGDGTSIDRCTPIMVNGLSNVIAISGGRTFSLALKNDGTVWAWGYNGYGQLGDGTTTQRKTPVQVSNLTGVAAIAAGYYYSVALKQNGTVWAWGQNDQGQLGDGTTTDRCIPGQVSSISSIVAITTNESHSLATKSNGTIWAWGRNSSGQLGDGTFTSTTVPVQVNHPGNVGTTITTGWRHSMLLQPDGNIWVWGFNCYGQLGIPGCFDYYTTPIQCQTEIAEAPVIIGQNQVSIDCLSGKSYHIAITGQDIANLGGISFTIEYDPAYLTPKSINNSALPLTMGMLPGSKFTITAISPGLIVGEYSESIPVGEIFQGVLCIVKFVGNSNGSTVVNYQTST